MVEYCRTPADHWANWVLNGNDAIRLPHYSPLNGIHTRIKQAIRQAIEEAKQPEQSEQTKLVVED